MHEGEIGRLKEAYRNLQFDDSAGLTRLRNETRTVLIAVLGEKEAKHYLDGFADLSFYSLFGDRSDDARQWPEGVRKAVAVLESVEHHLRIRGVTPSKKVPSQTDRRKAFIVHGHDHPMLHEIEAFVRRIGIQPIILKEEASRGGTVIEKFERNADVPFAIVLLSLDDIGRATSSPPGSEKRRPRQNAVLEAGFFIGRLDRQNVTIVVDADHDAEAEYPSDLAGVVTIHYAPGGDWKTRLMREFKASDIEHDPSKA